MFTVCPGCSRQFLIYAEHIAAAKGQVRCGFCHMQFNALERLSDEPVVEEASPVLPEAMEEPQFELPEKEPEKQDAPTDLDDDILIAKNESNTEEELRTAIDEIGVKAKTETEQTPIFEEEISEPEEQTPVFEENISKPAEQAPQVGEKKYHFDFTEPEDLLEPEPTRTSLGLRLFWAGATTLALLIIVAQLAWFNRDQVLLKYPQLLPYTKQLCAKLNCSVIRQRDAKAIKLINRDVRLHPRFEDTLLVNATMVNELSFRQPYPRVQLTLFDTSGALLGHRNFVPTDYLDSSIDLDQGMPVDAPVHFVLEVSGPTAGAVSFEFRFL